MRALAVAQPFATLIALGAKRVEIRTWRVHHRGELLITSSKRADVAALARAAARMGGDTSPASKDWPRGVAVCVVELVDVRPLTPSDAVASACRLTRADCAGRWAWVLRRSRAVQPVALRGRLSLFEVDGRLVRILDPHAKERRCAY